MLDNARTRQTNRVHSILERFAEKCVSFRMWFQETKKGNIEYIALAKQIEYVVNEPLDNLLISKVIERGFAYYGS